MNEWLLLEMEQNNEMDPHKVRRNQPSTCEIYLPFICQLRQRQRQEEWKSRKDGILWQRTCKCTLAKWKQGFTALKK